MTETTGWIVVPFMDGERMPRVHKIFSTRREAEAWTETQRDCLEDGDCFLIERYSQA